MPKHGVRSDSEWVLWYVCPFFHGVSNSDHIVWGRVCVPCMWPSVMSRIGTTFVYDMCVGFVSIRTPELNVRNGVLKSLSFMFEYIGEMGKDYVDTVAPLLEDALIDRDVVHRQTACWAVKHLALGKGMGSRNGRPGAGSRNRGGKMK